MCISLIQFGRMLAKYDQQEASHSSLVICPLLINCPTCRTRGCSISHIYNWASDNNSAVHLYMAEILPINQSINIQCCYFNIWSCWFLSFSVSLSLSIQWVCHPAMFLYLLSFQYLIHDMLKDFWNRLNARLNVEQHINMYLFYLGIKAYWIWKLLIVLHLEEYWFSV